MKLAAHPLVVAVALGLLPAHALAEEDAGERRRDDSLGTGPTPCAGCPEAGDDVAIQGVLDALQALPSELEG